VPRHAAIRNSRILHSEDDASMRGRKPKATVLKLVRGERRASRLNPSEARVPVARLEPPSHLAGPALAKWIELAPQLARAGILTELDRDCLTCYCLEWSTVVRTQEKIDRVGEVVKGYRGSLVVNPFVRVRDRALEMVRRFGEQLGLSPSARSRVHATTPDEYDPAAKYLD